MSKLVLITVALVIGAASGLNQKLSSSLLLSLKKNDKLNVMISFDQTTDSIVRSIESIDFPSRTEKITALKSNLERQADISQGQVRSYLKQSKVSFKSFWITNQISIRGASKDIILAVAELPNVKVVDLEKRVELPKTVEGHFSEEVKGIQGTNWGTDKIQAQAAWRISNGSGVIVANIDSGVRLSHESLRDNFAGEYGWFDPVFGEETPYDDGGHGTHVMGTIAGTRSEIGIAPGAKWMACKGWGDWEFGWQSYLISCGEWLVCPTRANGSNPDCSKSPVVVANSWSDEPDAVENWFQPVTDAWIAAGIVPVFAAGNYGPQCGTTKGPGNTTRVISVGATNIDDQIATFSSVGPTRDGRVKPELSAPGQNIHSASHLSDGGYVSKSGTSMACPHMSGAVALLKSLDPSLSFDQVRQALMAAVDQNLTFRNITCGGRSDNQFPNNHFGTGRLNALKLVEAALAAKQQKHL